MQKTTFLIYRLNIFFEIHAAFNGIWLTIYTIKEKFCHDRENVTCYRVHFCDFDIFF